MGSMFDFYSLCFTCTRNNTGFPQPHTSRSQHSFLVRVHTSTNAPKCIIKQFCVCLLVPKLFHTEIYRRPSFPIPSLVFFPWMIDKSLWIWYYPCPYWARTNFPWGPHFPLHSHLSFRSACSNSDRPAPLLRNLHLFLPIRIRLFFYKVYQLHMSPSFLVLVLQWPNSVSSYLFASSELIVHLSFFATFLSLHCLPYLYPKPNFIQSSQSNLHPTSKEH